MDILSQHNKMLYSFSLIFLFQLRYAGGSVVFQSSSLTVDVGTNVTLTCDIANAFGQCSLVRWLLYQHENGLKVYISGSRTVSKKTYQEILCTLTISQATLSDNGTFYCLLLNDGVDYMGNGTALTVMATDRSDKQNMNINDHKTDLQQVKECHCLVPLAVLGGISLLIILGMLAMCVCYRRAILMHQRDCNASQQQQQSSGETHYATLMFESRRHDRVSKS